MDRPLHVLLLTHNYPRFDGDYAGVFLHTLARRLPEHGVGPVVLAPWDPGTAESEERDGVRIVRFRYARQDDDHTLAYRGNMHRQVFRFPSGPFRFYRFLKSFESAARALMATESPDVIAGHWLIPAGIVMGRLRRHSDAPMLLSSHGTDLRLLQSFPQVYGYFRPLMRSLYRYTVVSNFLRDAILKIDSALEDITRVLPLPHDETVFYPDDSITREDNLIVAVTRFTEQKRVTNLIRAFGKAAEENAECRLEIYGAGPLQSQVEYEIARAELGGRITLLPPVSQAELRTVYNRAAMVVLNSEREGFGLTLSEAQLCGAAVIGTDSGGITDIIKHERTGLLVPLDDEAALSQAMLRLLNDQTERRRLADAGREFAAKTFASGPLAAQYADLLKTAGRK